MRKVTIGEVLRLERVHQGKKLSQIQKATDIQMEYLEAMERDEFDQLPSSFYARSFIKKYAWELSLDDALLLKAYEEGSMIAYDEIEVDEQRGRTTRIERRKVKSFLPIVYFVALSLFILSTVAYFVWNYSTNHVTEVPIEDASSISASQTSGASTEDADKISLTTKTVYGVTYVTVSGVDKSVDVTLHNTSTQATWYSISGTASANGVTLVANGSPVTERLETNSEYAVALGSPQMIELTLNGQKVELQDLADEPTTIVLQITKDSEIATTETTVGTDNGLEIAINDESEE